MRKLTFWILLCMMVGLLIAPQAVFAGISPAMDAVDLAAQINGWDIGLIAAVSGNTVTVTGSASGLVVAYNLGESYPYPPGSSTNIITWPDNASASWTQIGSENGISYANGSNNGFIALPGMSVNVSGDNGVLGDANIINRGDAWQNPFSDLKPGDWFFGDVEYVVTKGYFTGTTPATFSPQTPMTRGMLVTVLWRLAGSPDERIPAAAGGGQFTDVAEDAYYYLAVNWAAAKGIVKGIGGGRFAPGNSITRQDLAVILMRYADFMKLDLVATRQDASFKDEDMIGEYAKDAVYALYSAGAINGKDDNTVDPRGFTTRAEVAAMLHRFTEVAK